MMTRFRILFGFAVCLGLATPSVNAGAYKVYSTYLWHLQQPNYWPEKHPTLDRYTFAYEHLQGSATYPGHPQNTLGEIFGKDDRVAVYQYRARDAVAAMNQPDGGAQLSYSGCLIENINSLGYNYSLGYTPGWHGAIREAMGWQTSRGKRKLEPLGFTYHHALAPLIDKEALKKEIQLNKHIWWKTWLGYDDPQGTLHPKGFRCAEETFSIRIIKELVEAGYEWVIVPNHHLSRTHPNYVQLHGKGLYDAPNRADQINPPNTGAWFSGEIDGRGATESVPFSFQAHRAKYVDPENGQEYSIVVVPMSDVASYRDGYSPQGIEILHTLNAQANYAQPCLALFSHDGDNAWGGGFSYYGEAVPSFAGQAAAAGYRPTTIQTFLDENPPPADDYVHVEDGSWVNAADDWGHPQFWNWLWYPQRDRNSPEYDYNDPSTYADIENGWAEDFRNWAVIVAAQNYVSTAEQIELDAGSGRVDDWRIQDPLADGANDAELAWHFFLPALTSGYMYYGSAIDMEVKPSLACNQGVAYAENVLSGRLEHDHTGPTVFIPQRYPCNPGSTNYGSAYGYRSWVASSDFHIWTFAYDVSSVTSVVLRVRADADGVNPLSDNSNEVYNGGVWQTIPMTRRLGSSFAGNIFNDPKIDFFIMPTVIADQFTCKVTGYRNQLLDYYVEAGDARGNLKRTDIQHVYVGGEGSGTPVHFDPVVPSDCEALVVTYDASGGPLAGAGPVWQAWSTDQWVSTNYVAMHAAGADHWVVTNTLVAGVTRFDVAFGNGSGTVDDNAGAGWGVGVTPCVSNDAASVKFEPPAPEACEDVRILYHPGSGPLAGAAQVYIHVGRNAWQDVVTPDPAMLWDGTNWVHVYSPQPETVQLNCVFNDGGAVWDNNGGQDWQLDLASCGGGEGNLVRFAPGSPTLLPDPANSTNQNAVGDAFDLNRSGGDAVTVNQGGFGNFGHVYLNYDETHFTIGGLGMSLTGPDDAAIIFLDFDTLGDDAGTLWDLNGPPAGLDALHNLAFTTPMDIAVLLGDEFGDGDVAYTNFLLESGAEFGQGAFYLSTGTGGFVPVAGARLSQYDGDSTNAVVTADDDGNRQTDRWELAIPWGSLNAASGIASIASCRLAGVLVRGAVTNGVDRYLSSNFIGASATNVGARTGLDYGYAFVSLGGITVEMPNIDSDGDGLPDAWEIRYYGNATNAQATADDDGDGLHNAAELQLGTDPRSAASALRVVSNVRSGNVAVITWQSVGARRYVVEYSTNLQAASGGFTTLVEQTEQDVPDGIGDLESAVDAMIAPSNYPVFYRIQNMPL